MHFMKCSVEALKFHISFELSIKGEDVNKGNYFHIDKCIPPYECTYGRYYGLVVVTPRPPPLHVRRHFIILTII